MQGKALPDAKQSLTLRDVPADVLLAVKHAQTNHNVAHPASKITVTDVVSFAVRDWIKRGGQLPASGG